jgi:hypothetical protein
VPPILGVLAEGMNLQFFDRIEWFSPLLRPA